MMGALSSAVLSAAYLGWLVGRIVPLLPNWLGALSAACTVGYLTTLQDGRGDMLRFLGFSLCRCVSVLSATVDDVALRDRAGALLGHVLFFSQSVDSKYKVVARLQLLLTEFVSRLTMLIARCAQLHIFLMLRFLTCSLFCNHTGCVVTCPVHLPPELAVAPVQTQMSTIRTLKVLPIALARHNMQHIARMRLIGDTGKAKLFMGIFLMRMMGEQVIMAQILNRGLGSDNIVLNLTQERRVGGVKGQLHRGVFEF